MSPLARSSCRFRIQNARIYAKMTVITESIVKTVYPAGPPPVVCWWLSARWRSSLPKLARRLRLGVQLMRQNARRGDTPRQEEDEQKQWGGGAWRAGATVLLRVVRPGRAASPFVFVSSSLL